MRSRKISWLRLSVTILRVTLIIVVASQLAGGSYGQQATRAVRLSSVDGQVQLSQGNQVLASQAMANAPLFEGGQITTSDDGRAEIQFEDGSVARVSPNSSLLLSSLQEAETSVTLNSGLAYFEIQNSTQANSFRIHFGDSTVSASGFTVVRVNLDSPPGEVAVFSGNVHVDGANGIAVDMHGGESLKLNAETAGNYTLSETIEPDSWDTWNADRDQALTAQEGQRTEATGNLPDNNNPAWSDLDANGNWYNVPGQGYVWSPNEAMNPGWDPYGCGNWMWTPGYGYVWVSCQSWGYMPYAYGSWSYYSGFGWGWAPGFGAPWWGGGIYVININRAPYLYKPPFRPRGGPVKPGGYPVHVAGGKFQPYPVVPVNRNGGTVPASPVRPRSGPVTVAGSTVTPLRPVAPRAGYVRGEPGMGVSQGFVPAQGFNSNVSGPVYGINGINTGSHGIIARPPTYYGNTYRPAPPSGMNYAPRPAAPIYSAPAPSRPAGGPVGGAPRMSSGGGAAPHPSGGAAPHR
jgi:hypothetical protein